MSRLQLKNSSSHHSIYSNLTPPPSPWSPAKTWRKRDTSSLSQRKTRKCWNPNWQTSTAVRRRSEYFRPRSFDISDNGFWFGVKIPNKLVPVKTNTSPENWWLEDEISFFWVDILVFKKYGFAGHFSHQPCPFFPSFVSQKQHLFFSGPQLRGPRKCKRGGTDGKVDRCFFVKPHVMSDVLIYHHMMVFFLCCHFHLKLIKKVLSVSPQVN